MFGENVGGLFEFTQTIVMRNEKNHDTGGAERIKQFGVVTVLDVVGIERLK